MMPGAELRSRRAYYHLSQTRLAEMLGVARNTIGEWEKAEAPEWTRYIDWGQIKSDEWSRKRGWPTSADVMRAAGR